jgi:hypothetical protein
MDLGMTGYQIIGGVAGSYAADAPVDGKVQIEETSNTLLLEFVCPVHCEVVAFGVNIVEDFTAQATDPVVSLKKALTVGGAETLLAALTLGNSNTVGGVVILTRGNGDRNVLVDYPKDNQVALAADTDLDTGDVVYADLHTLTTDDALANRHFWPGEVIILEHTTAATGAGGAYVPWAIIKMSGPDFTQDNTWRELRAGETLLD